MGGPAPIGLHLTNDLLARLRDEGEHETYPPAGPLDSGGTVKATTLVPFSLDANGNCWCFLTSEDAQDGEYSVAYYDAEHVRLYGRLSGFQAWLTTLLNGQDEVIRTLYNSDTIENELGLG